jgi:apolipoprotein N-acyltransferase
MTQLNVIFDAMHSNVPTLQSKVIAAVLAVIAGVLLALSYSNDPYWWAAWLASIPALAGLLIAPTRWRPALSVGIGVLSGALSFDYRVTTGSITAAWLIGALFAFGWWGTLRLAVSFADRGQGICAAFALPVGWAAIDTLLIHLSPHGSIGSLAYSQIDALPVLQLASLAGVPAIKFVILLPGSVAGLWLARWWGAKRQHGMRLATAMSAAIVIASLLFGIARLDQASLASAATISLITSDRHDTRPRDWVRFQSEYGEAINRAANPGTTVVLPEAVLRVDTAGLEQATTELTKIARSRRANIVVGIVVDDGGVITNRALIAFQDGRSATYSKQHLVPGLERATTPGNHDLVADIAIPGTGIAICKDLHFPTLGRSYANRGARLMLVPANDFEVDGRLMMMVTAIRGVEGGYSVARAARGGISSISDGYGRILSSRQSGLSTATLTSAAPRHIGRTLYSRIGDLFGFLCFLCWVGLIGFDRLYRRRSVQV